MARRRSRAVRGGEAPPRRHIHHAEHHLAEAFDRHRAGVLVGGGDARPLLAGEFAFQRATFVSELQQTLPAALWQTRMESWGLWQPVNW